MKKQSGSSPVIILVGILLIAAVTFAAYTVTNSDNTSDSSSESALSSENASNDSSPLADTRSISKDGLSIDVPKSYVESTVKTSEREGRTVLAYSTDDTADDNRQVLIMQSEKIAGTDQVRDKNVEAAGGVEAYLSAIESSLAAQYDNSEVVSSRVVSDAANELEIEIIVKGNIAMDEEEFAGEPATTYARLVVRNSSSKNNGAAFFSSIGDQQVDTADVQAIFDSFDF